MVLIYLKGGLGNQMFEYAAGKALATHLNVPFKIDKSYYDNKEYIDESLNNFFNIAGFRDILNNNFEITAETAATEEVKQFRPGFIGKVIDRLTPRYSRKVYREKFTINDKYFYRLKKNVLLNGYFQSEKYFKPYADIVRKELSFKPLIKDRNKELASKILEGTSVSVHVRRGDYVNNAETTKVITSLDLEYYFDSKKHLEKTLQKPINYFVFSDDIEWVKTKFTSFADVTYVDKSFGNSDVDDMYLMSCCKHNIIANSSFSWWAAWLNSNSNKIVIAPKKWFNVANLTANDLVPDNWIRI
jgi:hypothetical protein